MNEPLFAAGSKIKVRMVVDRTANPGKHPNATSKGKSGIVRGYGGYDTAIAVTPDGQVNHQYVIKLDDGPVVVLSESWLEPA